MNVGSGGFLSSSLSDPVGGAGGVTVARDEAAPVRRSVTRQRRYHGRRDAAAHLQI